MAENLAPAARVEAPAARTDERRWAAWANRNARLILPLPAVLAVLGMLAFPLGYTLWMSFQEWTISSTSAPSFVGIRNYSTLFTADPRFLNSIKITFYFTALGVTVQTFLGVAMALAFNREFWGRGLLRTLAILPMVATPVAIALIFVMMFHPTLGVMNYFLTVVGLPPALWTYSSGSVIP